MLFVVSLLMPCCSSSFLQQNVVLPRLRVNTTIEISQAFGFREGMRRSGCVQFNLSDHPEQIQIQSASCIQTHIKSTQGTRKFSNGPRIEAMTEYRWPSDSTNHDMYRIERHSLAQLVCYHNKSFHLARAPEICECTATPKEETRNFFIVTLLHCLKAIFVLFEFGPRPLKNVKKICSCGLGCFLLCRVSLENHYQAKEATWTEASRSWLVVYFLVLNIVIKALTLSNVFKTRKNFRLIKLLKLVK